MLPSGLFKEITKAATPEHLPWKLSITSHMHLVNQVYSFLVSLGPHSPYNYSKPSQWTIQKNSSSNTTALTLET